MEGENVGGDSKADSGHTLTRRIFTSMNTKGVERLITQRWPKLKKKLQNENDPGKLISILQEIDDLLSNLEMKMVAQTRHADSERGVLSTSVSRFYRVPSVDSEGGINE
jgi:hypothetical protein